MIGHLIAFPEPSVEERLSGITAVVQCDTCHSPDEFGIGSARFTGSETGEAWDKFEQHVDETETT